MTAIQVINEKVIKQMQALIVIKTTTQSSNNLRRNLQ